MLKNYLVSALRNIKKNRLASLITIVGFSVGIAVALLIFLYIQYEYSFDKFLSGHERIYRMMVKATTMDGGEFQTATVDFNVKDLLLARNNGIESITRISQSDANIGYDNRTYFEQNDIYMSDSSFLKVFSFPLAVGDRDTALEKPMSVILSPEKARKFFGDENPIGKLLSFSNNSIDKTLYFTVTGVLAPVPANSSFRFDFVVNLPFEKYIVDILDYYNRVYHANASVKYNNFQGQIFVSLKSNSYFNVFQRSLRDALDGISNDIQYTYKSYRLACEPLGGIYLFSKIDSPGDRRGNFLFILLLAGLGVIVIVIACINVVNLATARGMTRAKEIGIRKALGASRKEVRLQCLVESVLLSFVSLWFALALVEIFLPSFDHLIKRDLAIHYLSNPSYLLAIVGVAFMVGLLSGLYPAMYLSSFSVIATLRGQRTPSSRKFREAMVVIQFVFAIGLFISSAVILREFRSVKEADSGLNPRNVVMARMNIPWLESKFPGIKKAIANVPGVLGVSGSSFAAWEYGSFVRDLPVMVNSKMKYCDVMVVDPDFLRIHEIEMADGKDFDPEYDNPEVNQLIMNEAARREIGWKVGSYFMNEPIKGKIVGVAKDFDYLLPVKKVRPLLLTTGSPFLINNAFAPAPLHLGYLLVKIQEGDRDATLRRLRDAWRGLFPDLSFEYQFEEDEILRQLDDYYRSFEGALYVSTILSFLLSALGLFGLASFETERRTKEIGIRKALGATSMQIVAHFLVGFLKLIALANLVAWPATFVLLRAVFGLVQYPRILFIGPLVFFEAGAISALVMALTVGAQTLRAAVMNPVDTLRYE
jgi:putative ABC transport system permease protein